MKRVSGWVASAAAGLLAVPAMAGEDVDAKLAEMQELVQGLQQKVEAQDEQIEHQGKLLQDAQRVVRADEQGSLSGLATFLDSIEIDGAAIASYNINMNNGDNDASVNTGSPNNPGANSGQSGLFLPYHQDDNTFQVDQIWFGLGKPATEESRGGFRFDLFYGAMASFYGTGIFDDNGDDSSRRASRDSTSDYAIDQAYVEYIAPIADINLRMGKFATPLGAESNRQWENFNITHGIVDQMQPVNHIGLIGTVPIGDMVELGAGIVDSGGSSISAPDDTYEKSYLATAKFGNDRGNVRGTFVYGSEPSITLGNSIGDQVGLADVTAFFNPSDNLSLWANYDYLFNEGTGYYANGIALAGRLGIQDFGVAVRGEFVREHADGSGNTLLTTSVDNESDIWTLTGTLDYALTEHLTVKTEVVWDRVDGNTSSSDCCEYGSGPGNYKDKDQYVWLIAAQYVF